LLERAAIKLLSRHSDHLAVGLRALGRRARAAFEQRPLADDCPGPELGDNLAVDDRLEYAVEDEEDEIEILG
jgi:hypothetical protein